MRYGPDPNPAPILLFSGLEDAKKSIFPTFFVLNSISSDEK
jgi:hypothetical protein